ncbi:hypothetical protein [Polymorphospora sp. NPDC050346]
MTVCAQPVGIAVPDLDRLAEIGLHVATDEETFRSTRFGSS